MLVKLQQQKRLIEQHLTWLNQEIEAESGQASPVVSTPLQSPQPVVKPQPPVEPEIQPAAPQPPPDEEVIEEISEELISRYSGESDRREMNPKLGCVLYFVGALGFIIAVVYAIYWFGYR